MTEQERQAFINAISFEGEIEDCDGVLIFTVKKDFDPAAVFQDIYKPAAEPPPFRIGVPYCIVDQMIWYTMDLYFGCPGDMKEDIRTFPLSDSERECLKGKVFDYCHQLTGMSLREYGRLHWPEDYEPVPDVVDLLHPIQSEESASQPISGFDFMDWYVNQCIEQMVRDMERKATPEEWRNIVAEAQQHEQLSDLRRTADELTTYAAERQAGFEQHRAGSAYRQPETRNEWIRDILRGMAEVNGSDGDELIARFDRQLEEARRCFGAEMLPQSGQEHLVQSLSVNAGAIL